MSVASSQGTARSSLNRRKQSQQRQGANAQRSKRQQHVTRDDADLAISLRQQHSGNHYAQNSSGQWQLLQGSSAQQNQGALRRTNSSESALALGGPNQNSGNAHQTSLSSLDDNFLVDFANTIRSFDEPMGLFPTSRGEGGDPG